MITFHLSSPTSGWYSVILNILSQLHQIRFSGVPNIRSFLINIGIPGIKTRTLWYNDIVMSCPSIRESQS